MLAMPTIFGHTFQAMAEVPERPTAPLRVAASDCLLGSPVRYNGAHKKSSLPHDEFADLFEFVGFCPEVAIGLGTPRVPINLVGDQHDPRAVTVSGEAEALDLTRQLQAQAELVLPALRGVAGYVFMHRSPSCGLYSVKVYGAAGSSSSVVGGGRGIYAQRLGELQPELPMEECGRLFEPEAREHFVTRVFTYAHWQALMESGPSAAQLVEFHARYKYLLMAHSVSHTTSAGQQLGNLAGDAEHLKACAIAYFRELMAGLAKPATRGGHANSMSHLQGYVKQALTGADRAELARVIEEYRLGTQPLNVPLTLLRHHIAHHADEYAARQIYLDPVCV